MGKRFVSCNWKWKLQWMNLRNPKDGLSWYSFSSIRRGFLRGLSMLAGLMVSHVLRPKNLIWSVTCWLPPLKNATGMLVRFLPFFPIVSSFLFSYYDTILQWVTLSSDDMHGQHYFVKWEVTKPCLLLLLFWMVPSHVNRRKWQPIFFG